MYLLFTMWGMISMHVTKTLYPKSHTHTHKILFLSTLWI